MRTPFVRSLLALLVLGMCPAVAVAQDRPAGNVDFGYAAIYDTDLDGWFANGWKGSIAGALGRHFEIVGEVGRSTKSLRAPEFDVTFKLAMFNMMGGARFVGRPTPRTAVFGQLLLGGVRVTGSLEDCGALADDFCNDAEGESQSDTFLAAQPGGGVDIFFTRRLGLRLQGDYRAVFEDIELEGESEVLHEFRFAAGVVFTFGGR